MRVRMARRREEVEEEEEVAEEGRGGWSGPLKEVRVRGEEEGRWGRVKEREGTLLCVGEEKQGGVGERRRR